MDIDIKTEIQSYTTKKHKTKMNESRPSQVSSMSTTETKLYQRIAELTKEKYVSWSRTGNRNCNIVNIFRINIGLFLTSHSHQLLHECEAWKAEAHTQLTNLVLKESEIRVERKTHEINRVFMFHLLNEKVQLPPGELLLIQQHVKDHVEFCVYPIWKVFEKKYKEKNRNSGAPTVIEILKEENKKSGVSCVSLYDFAIAASENKQEAEIEQQSKEEVNDTMTIEINRLNI